MILQYRLPFDVPELDARAGDIVVVDTRFCTVDVSREVPAAVALPLLAQLIPSLEPMGEETRGMPVTAAAALVRALAPVPASRSHARRRGLRLVASSTSTA